MVKLVLYRGDRQEHPEPHQRGTLGGTGTMVEPPRLFRRSPGLSQAAIGS